jgi:AbiV family abortive infection protein
MTSKPPSTESQDTAPEGVWEQLVEAVATGQLPVFEVMKSTASQLYKEGHDEGFVMFTRAFHMLMSDPRILQRFHGELGDEMEKALGKKPNMKAIESAIRSKDGPRRMKKLADAHAEMYGDGLSLLSGATFDECMKQYSSLIGQVEHLWDEACRFYRSKQYALATFFSILAIEEIGKLGRLWFDLLAWDRPLEAKNKGLGVLGRDHRMKHFTGVVAGAVINARLDRILGIKNIRRLLQDAESGKIEPLRQSCLYIDMVDGAVRLPEDQISEGTARFFTVLSGELWAEILGHFPWDFKRMITRVIEYELELGFRKEDVERI